ncbi:MAG: diaminopimelate epimerase [Candidatus Geothermincolia bacterium]
MEFSKYEAAANDFIMLDRMSDGPLVTPQEARILCDRRTGVGADGVIEMLPSDACDIRMRILNADGSEAQMCGNGVRALFLFALDRGVISSTEIDVETMAGTKRVKQLAVGERVSYSVEMGAPTCLRGEVPMTGPVAERAVGVTIDLPDGGAVEATCVSMGNPHCVVFVEQGLDASVSLLGPVLETHELFPERTNVEFVKVVSDSELEVRVWERGVGETMACGTGACASLVAASLVGLTGRRATVLLPGGELEVEWRDEGVVLTGPARHVFDGKTVE